MHDKNKVDEQLLLAVREQAEEQLKYIISKTQLGYEAFVISEMIQIFKEKGIVWKPENRNELVD